MHAGCARACSLEERASGAGCVHNVAALGRLRAKRQLEVPGAASDHLAHLQPLAGPRQQLRRKPKYLWQQAFDSEPMYMIRNQH